MQCGFARMTVRNRYGVTKYESKISLNCQRGITSETRMSVLCFKMDAASSEECGDVRYKNLAKFDFCRTHVSTGSVANLDKLPPGENKFLRDVHVTLSIFNVMFMLLKNLSEGKNLDSNGSLKSREFLINVASQTFGNPSRM